MALALSLGIGVSANAPAATPTPLAGLDFLTQITIPNWTTSGATQASTDIWSFDPLTSTLYFADRINNGVSAIDTAANTYLGTLVVPGCNGTANCPSGVLVAPDLHKLVVTDRNITGTDLNHIFIYDLRILSAPPVQLTLPSGQATDELDYDPLNQRAYVANLTAPHFLTVVDLVSQKIVDQIPLPSNPEQTRFNPVDGFIYQAVPDDEANAGANSAVLRIDTTKTGAATIVKTLVLGPSCPVRGMDIDPLTNTAMVGCGGTGAQVLIDLSGDMSMLNTFPGIIGGTDTLQFNRNLRRWYTASNSNLNNGVQCPGNGASPQVFPVIGVFGAATKNHPANMVGVECSGTNGHDIGVDPVHNQVYVGVR
jgi:DNA-binding beta-propeller fold protein YncE